MNPKPTAIGLLAFLLSFGLRAQQGLFIEAGPYVGIANYQGDLAEATLELGETHLAYGLYIRNHITSKLTLQAGIFKSVLTGSDANSPKLAPRNLSFRADLIEVSLRADYYPFARRKGLGGRGDYRIVTPYLFAGVGMAFAEPEVNYENTPIEYIQEPFPEEGSTGTFFIVPVGVGLRFQARDRLALNLDFGWRGTGSDLLDGVSKNGRPDRRDWYVLGGATLVFKLIKDPACQF